VYNRISYIQIQQEGQTTMSTISVSELTGSIAALLSEAYAGPPDAANTWFVDNQPDAGLLGLLKTVSPQEASASPSGQPGTTIASHVEHLRWSLANANAALRGEAYNPDWSESWNRLDADEAAWDGLRQSLRSEFETLHQAILRQEQLPGEYLNGVLALVPHAAYHLGVIRQMISALRG
jgi:hypothetical protein